MWVTETGAAFRMRQVVEATADLYLSGAHVQWSTASLAGQIKAVVTSASICTQIDAQAKAERVFLV